MWEKYSARAWDICVALANTPYATTIYSRVEIDVGYRPEEPYARFHGTKATKFLTPIAEHCGARGLPLLSLMVRQKGGGYGNKIHAFLRRDLAAEIAAVRDFDWSQETNPFIDEEVIADAQLLLDGGVDAAQQLSRMQYRGYRQKVFREALLKAYGGQCAVCSIQHPALLEAAHLKPWSVATEAERVDVRNGLLLCRNHHAALDRGFWQIRREKTGEYSVATVRTANSQPLGREVLMSDALRLPQTIDWQPKAEWLLHRRDFKGRR